jgi:flagellar hook-associated protein 1 FlgK
MSISASLANALTGLTTASRAAELVSSNVANAMTEGYARRELDLSSKFTGGIGSGVQVDGVRRIVDEVAIRERRLAAADVGYSGASVDFLRDLMTLVGEPGDAGSLADLQARFEASLLEAASRPDSDIRLANVLSDAAAFADKLNSIGDGIQTLREDADRDISQEVGRLNDTLKQVADLNDQILRSRTSASSYPELLDQRQRLVDSISELVPIRQLPRENGTIALYSMTGALLVDARPAEFGFAPTAPITADMTQASGALSGLTLNGSPIDTAGTNSPISGGRLAGLFDVRDRAAVSSQANLDELARDLVTRFESPGPDPTILPGAPGLFTDGGNALDITDLEGLASRVSINPLVDPAAGGALWRLRDGIGAAAPGPIGNGTILAAYSTTLADARAPSGGAFGTAAKTSAGFVSALTSEVARGINAESNQLSFANARFDTLRNTELALGVDTDQEMQKLLLIEQAYAANARVVQTIDDLIQTLIGL